MIKNRGTACATLKQCMVKKINRCSGKKTPNTNVFRNQRNSTHQNASRDLLRKNCYIQTLFNETFFYVWMVKHAMLYPFLDTRKTYLSQSSRYVKDISFSIGIFSNLSRERLKLKDTRNLMSVLSKTAV